MSAIAGASDTIDVEARIGHWCAGLELSAVPPDVRKTATTSILDTIGVAIAGTTTSIHSTIDHMLEQGGRHALFNGKRAAHPGDAALLNGVAAHALDLDDTCFAGIVHGSAVVLPAVHAACEIAEASADDMLLAYVCGIEAECALGNAFTDALYERGYWTTATLGAMGAAVGAAKGMRMSATQVAEAVRLAAQMAPGMRSSHGSDAKPFLCGHAARIGLECALAARAGVTCTSGALLGPFGFAAVHNQGVFRRECVEALGQRWSLRTPGIAYKFYPLCSATQAAIEASLSLRPQIGSRSVSAITCRATPFAVGCLPYRHPASPGQAQFSLTFAVACALLHGDVGIDHLSPAVVAAPEITQLMDRIRVVPDHSITTGQDMQQVPEAASVELVLDDGSNLSATVLAATGMPFAPADEQRLKRKFIDCASRVFGIAIAESLHRQFTDMTGLPLLALPTA
ncbi:MAG: MmgE/PrpD family protein [Lautropia sp.]